MPHAPVLLVGLGGTIAMTAFASPDGGPLGHVPETWVPHLEAAARRIPVVLASRTGAGSVATSTYGFAGSERDLIARGLVPAGVLDPYKSRLLLHLALAAGATRPDVTAAFAAAGHLDPDARWPWPDPS